MNKHFLSISCLLVALQVPGMLLAKTPDLGTAANFALFSSAGAVTDAGGSRITGNVGTNTGSSTGFGNVNGVMHDNDGASALCAADLLLAHTEISSAIPGFFPSNLLGNGQNLGAGVYSIPSAATLNQTLTLNADGDADAVFIFQIGGAFASGAAAKVVLANGAQACNVFWTVEGMVSLEAGTHMRGTVIANNAAIHIGQDVIIEGRALSTTGEVLVSGTKVNTPAGCGIPLLSGPALPALGTASCYALFSADGENTNTGITMVTGDVGTNVGLATGYNALNVDGMIHTIPDASTALCASDLLNLHGQISTLDHDIQLLYPAQFGNSLVLTPHTYLLDAATSLTDTIFLNAQGNADAVFIIQVNGALSTSTFAKVALINGTQPDRVFWTVEGAVDISDNSEFEGTIVCNNGAMTLNTGVVINGRALTTTGALHTFAITAIIPSPCQFPVGIADGTALNKTGVSIYPNPSAGSFTLLLKAGLDMDDARLEVFNILGIKVLESLVQSNTTIISTPLAAGSYAYRVINANGVLGNGVLITQ